jgi:hypothetical protein
VPECRRNPPEWPFENLSGTAAVVGCQRSDRVDRDAVGVVGHLLPIVYLEICLCQNVDEILD